MDWKETDRRTRDILAKIGADIEPSTKMRDLSTAQRQLVQIARAFAFGARVLIIGRADGEPHHSRKRQPVRDRSEPQKTGGSIFYISHRLEEIQEIADRIAVLRDGKKVAELDAREATIDQMIEHMVGAAGGPRSVKERRASPVGGKVVLKVDKLSRHGEFRDISFELHEGEILGIAGLVGAGRTELVKCIFGDTQPDSGDVFIDGERVRIRYTRQGIRNGIAYVPEERRRLGLFPILSVAENMTLPILRKLTGILGIRKKREATLAAEYVSQLKIKVGGLGTRCAT